MKNLFLLLIFLSTLKMVSQSKELVGSWSFNKDVHQLKISDTLLLSQIDLFLSKNYNFNKNGDFEICKDTIPVKVKGKTVECIWKKIGTWTFNKPILTIILEEKSMNLFVNKVGKKSGSLQVVEVINKK